MLRNWHHRYKERVGAVLVKSSHHKQQILLQSWVCFCTSGVLLWIFNMRESAFAKDLPPSMHVIAFSDLHHFLGLLVSSSGDVIHHCTTPMTEFHSKCDYQPLCVGLGHRVCGKLSLGFEKDKVIQNGLVCSFHLFYMLTTWACYMWSGRAMSIYKWANYHSEGASEQISKDYTKIVQGWLSGQELF